MTIAEDLAAARAAIRDLELTVRQLEERQHPTINRRVRLARRDGENAGVFQDIIFQTGTQLDREEVSTFVAEKVAEPNVFTFEQDGTWYYLPMCCGEEEPGTDLERNPCLSCSAKESPDPMSLTLNVANEIDTMGFDWFEKLNKQHSLRWVGCIGRAEVTMGNSTEVHPTIPVLVVGSAFRVRIVAHAVTEKHFLYGAGMPDNSSRIVVELFVDAKTVTGDWFDTGDGTVYTTTPVADTLVDCDADNPLVLDGIPSTTATFWTIDNPGNKIGGDAPFVDDLPRDQRAPPIRPAIQFAAAASSFAATSSTVELYGDGGGNSITTITGDKASAGREVTCWFNDTDVSLVHDMSGDPDTIQLVKPHSAQAGSSLTLEHTGVFWCEKTRSSEPSPVDKQIITLAAAATTFAATGKLIVITGDSGGNTLATITGDMSFAGSLITLRFEDTDVTITNNQSHTTDSIALTRDFIGCPDGTLTLSHDGISWYETNRSHPLVQSITLGSGVTTFEAIGSTILLTGHASIPDIDTITGPRAVGGEDLFIHFQDADVDFSEITPAANTLKLSADFNSSADLFLHLHHNGTRWYEVIKTGT